MAEANPMTQSPGAAPTVSVTTLTIAGIKVDIYGLSELPPSATRVSCLWLHHPRLRRKEDMADTAHRILSAYHREHSSITGTTPTTTTTRGLMAVAFDQRNHGTRLVDARANDSWRGGNPTHAQDMFGTVSGTVADTVHLLDALEGYLFGFGGGPGGTAPAGGPPRAVDQHLVLGVSLGGHSAWQLLFAEPRVTAAVAVIGCPDYMRVMSDRARKSKLETYEAAATAASASASANKKPSASDEPSPHFLGSRDFPPALVAACGKLDPRGVVFGTADMPRARARARMDVGMQVWSSLSALSIAEQARVRALLDARLRGKRVQALSGGADKLVPHAASKPFLDFLADAAAAWYPDGGLHVEDRVYPGAGHVFSPEMAADATRFVLDSVALADGAGERGRGRGKM
ncbi:hypothetical protein GGR56DRAFT_583340 [Xylariaceae sp. FL0804]|nr:hypothetical protein GGR56DRAFT_583340 [Xylariaceae sp. FL0804]